MYICPNFTLETSSPEYQALKENLSEYRDDFLVYAIQTWRDATDAEAGAYPESADALKAFIEEGLSDAEFENAEESTDRDSVNNIYETIHKAYSAQTLNDRLDLLAQLFTDTLEHYVALPENREKTRAAVLREQGGYTGIMRQVFNLIASKTYDSLLADFGYSDSDSAAVKAKKEKMAKYLAQEYAKMLEHKNRLSVLAIGKVEDVESIHVLTNTLELDLDATEQPENSQSTDETKGDRYIDFRTTTVRDTTSVKLKVFVRDIPLTDNNGKVMRTDMGQTRKMGYRQVVYALRQIFLDSSPDTAVDDLTQAQAYYPWMKYLLAKLKANPDMFTELYATCKSVESRYYSTYASNKKGKRSYGVSFLNSRSGGKSLQRRAGTNMRSGYPLLQDSDKVIYGDGQLNKKKEQYASLSEKINTLLAGSNFVRTGASAKAVKDNTERNRRILEKYPWAGTTGQDSMDLFLGVSRKADGTIDLSNGYPEKIVELTDYLRGCGFEVLPSNVLAAAYEALPKQKNRKSLLYGKANRLDAILAGLTELHDCAELTVSRGEDIDYFYSIASNKALPSITIALNPTLIDDVDDRALINGKTYTTHTKVNRLHQVVDALANKEGLTPEEYRTWLTNEYLQYEGFTLNGEPVGWLADFLNGRMTGFQVVDYALFNNVEYSNLSDEQKMASAFTMWLQGSGTPGENYYEVPIQADYASAYNFVLARTLAVDKIRSADGSLTDTEFDNSELVRAVTDEVLSEIERKYAILQRLGGDVSKAKTVYEKAGLRFCVFPQMNDTDFLEQYETLQQESNELAYQYARRTVAGYLQDQLTKDRAKVLSSELKNNPYMEDLFTTDKETGQKVFSKEGSEQFDSFSLNSLYARLQMTKIFSGGLPQYGTLQNYEKRNMFLHAPHSSLYTKATWKGESVGRENENVVYLKDDESSAASDVLSDIVDALTSLRDRGRISTEQLNNAKKAYSKINSTDGQGYRTYDSYRAVRVMAGTWDDAHERAYKAIKAGKFTKRHINTILTDIINQSTNENIKPVMTGDEAYPAYGGKDQKPVKMPVLHKYSEAVLLPFELMQDASLTLKSAPLAAMSKAAQEYSRAHNGEEVDLFLFASGVKIGGFAVVDMFGTDKSGNRTAATSEQMKSEILRQIKENPLAVHKFPFKNYGIAAATPAHTRDAAIALSSQAEKQLWGNIRKGDKMHLRGEWRDSLWGRSTYDKVATATIVHAYQQLFDELKSPKKLEALLRQELATKPYNSPELELAITYIRDAAGMKRFALPLFSPSIEHNIQELITSVIESRLARHKMKGANILQVSSFGLDKGHFQGTELSDKDKLSVVYEGTGANKRVKYIECFIPITDKRLLEFADEFGEISPARLRDLIDKGQIDERILNFIAYRTPSDAEHSILPLRIKGFTNALSGSNIIVAKEAMNMTGHDYDGDKLRAHFMDFSIDWDEDKIRRAYRARQAKYTDEQIVRAVLGQDSLPKDMESLDEEKFVSLIKKMRRDNPNREQYRSAKIYEYDYSVDDPFAQGEDMEKKWDNARVELMFAEATSPEGSKRLVIPGGSELTNKYAKVHHLIDLAVSNPEIGAALSKKLNVPNSTNRLYEKLQGLSVGELSALIADVDVADSPFSFSHAVDAYRYMMGGASMIDVYAMYSSASVMFQKMQMQVANYRNSLDEEIPFEMFGKPLSALFDADGNQEIISLALARLVNAAVDNGKDPVLGYLNQTRELAPLTVLLLAGGYSEEELHLIMKQPAMVELSKRLTQRNSLGLAGEMRILIDELKSHADDALSASGNTAALKRFAEEYDTESFISDLGKSFDSVANGDDMDSIYFQCSLLEALSTIVAPATQLTELARVTRPEASTSGFGPTVQDSIARESALNSLRSAEANYQLRITGISEVIKPRTIHYGMTPQALMEKFGKSELPQVTALNTIYTTSAFRFLSRFFPQAKDNWRNFALRVAGLYDYAKPRAGLLEDIQNEMVLAKLQQKKMFIQDIEEERKKYLIDVPNKLQRILTAIKTAPRIQEMNEVRAAKREKLIPLNQEYLRLSKNIFLSRLGLSKAGETTGLQRIQFHAGGPMIEGLAPAIRVAWGELLSSSDEEIRQLAVDLYTYNLFASGFGYGMYEFAHMAPISVVQKVPGYIDAMYDVLENSSFNVDSENDNFIDQYYRNHWEDEHLVPNIGDAQLPKAGPDGVIQVENPIEGQLPIQLMPLKMSDYITTGFGANKKLYSVTRTTGYITLTPATPLGAIGHNGQVWVRYNLELNADQMKPLRNDAYFEAKQAAINTMASNSDPANIDNMPADTSRAVRQSTVRLNNPTAVKKVMARFAGQVDPADSKNDIMEESPVTTPATVAEAEAVARETGELPEGYAEIKGPNGQKMVVKGPMFYLARVSDGDVTTEKVPSNPRTVQEARDQRVFRRLDKRLKDLAQRKGIPISVVEYLEDSALAWGVTEFNTASVAAEGMKVAIRVAKGYAGEVALPEEFAHASLEMLGHDHPLVVRLLNALRSSSEGVQEAFEGQYDEYMEAYGNEVNSYEKMILEAAGKLVAKKMFQQQELSTRPLRALVSRIVSGIKSLWNRFTEREIQDAIDEANEAATMLARNLVSGRLLDEMKFENISSTGKFLNLSEKTEEKQSILHKLWENEVKRLHIYRKRLGFDKQRISSQTSIRKVELEVKRLERAIRNHKTEDALLGYLKYSLDFLKATETKLDNIIDSGASANRIAKQLNIVRDTVDSFSVAKEEIRKAVRSGELVLTDEMLSTLRDAEGVLTDFYDKYKRIGMTQFEGMLSSVYGEAGITVTLGKNKGRTVSIHEMATTGESDIPVWSRWLHSLADCNDYVLKAIDSMVQHAKYRALREGNDAKRRIDAAFQKYYKATGSRDQTFMFEYAVNPNTGKKEKTGRFISQRDAKNLTAPQKEFYDEMMALKKEIDALMPDALTDIRKIVMLRKTHLEKAKEAPGVKDAKTELWQAVRSLVLEDTGDSDTSEIEIDFGGSRVDRLPIKYLLKNKNESYDDMSDDVATAMLAYAGMAYEYSELDSIVNIIENAKYMSADRDIKQQSGLKQMVERVRNKKGNEVYTEPYTVKQARTRIQEVLEDYLQMQLYGHLQKEEGTIGKSKVSLRKTANLVSQLTSLSQMALNIPQRLSNVLTGQAMIGIESFGGGKVNYKTLTWATKEYVKQTGDRLMDSGRAESDNYLSLFREHFDVQQDNRRAFKRAGYGKGALSKIFNLNMLYAGMSAGEDYLASVTAMAIAKSMQVKDDKGNVTSLWDAYKVAYHDETNKTGAYLKLKDGYTKLDGSPITLDDEATYSRQIAHTNFKLQGIYNVDDRSAIQQYALGSLLIMYRKWIMPSLKRRYGGIQYDVESGEFEEGYWHTVGRFLADSWKSRSEYDKGILSSVLVNWEKLTDYEKSNMHRAITEYGIIGVLLLCLSVLDILPPDDDGKPLTWAQRQMTYQIYRLRSELLALAPGPQLFKEGRRILRDPMASLRPMQNMINGMALLNPVNMYKGIVQGTGPYAEEVKSGPWKGHTKVYRTIWSMPVLSMYKQFQRLIDPTPLINYYKNDNI